MLVEHIGRRQRGISAATFKSYMGHARHILKRLPVGITCEGMNHMVLEAYVTGEVARLAGRTHTVVKRMESLIKPALKLAHQTGRLPLLPLWPTIRSDYSQDGTGDFFLSREQFVALRDQLPDVRIIERETGRMVVYPRLWLDLAVSTGMHASDLDRFRGADYDRARALWFRRNSKGDRHYKPEWLPVDEFLQAALDAALARRIVDGDRLWIAEHTWDGQGASPLPPQWMRDQLDSAAKRANLPETPSPNDLRRTFATWRYDDGWRFEETAKWLANSSGMVRRVYAKIPPSHIVAAVKKSNRSARRLIAMTGPRRGPTKVSGETRMQGSESGSNIHNQGVLTHGKLSR